MLQCQHLQFLPQRSSIIYSTSSLAIDRTSVFWPYWSNWTLTRVCGQGWLMDTIRPRPNLELRTLLPI